MTQARFNLDEYTTRVLDVVKGKYGLKNREDALKRLVKEFGGEFVEPNINEETLMRLDEQVEEYEKSNQKRKMSVEELDNLLEL